MCIKKEKGERRKETPVKFAPVKKKTARFHGVNFAPYLRYIERGRKVKGERLKVQIKSVRSEVGGRAFGRYKLKAEGSRLKAQKQN